MRFRPLAVLAALALLGSAVHAQTAAERADRSADRAAVRRAALDYIEGFYEGDSTKLVRSVRPDVYKFGFWRGRDSTAYHTETMPWAEFLSVTRNVRARNRPVDPAWPKKVEVLDVQNVTAAAKVTAWWGTDYLLLGRFGDRWMIAQVRWRSPPVGARPATSARRTAPQ